jgi:hypothetical protein
MLRSMPAALTPSFASAFPIGHGAADFGSTLAGLLLKAGVITLVVNEVRGLILAAPILYGMYAAGGSWMALWIGFCSLVGIAISVAAPLFIAKKLKLLPARAA